MNLEHFGFMHLGAVVKKSFVYGVKGYVKVIPHDTSFSYTYFD